MRIRQNERFRPFSHAPGVKCPLPGTPYIVQVYPALVKVFEEEQLIEEMPVQLSGFVHDFTVQLDLEKGFVKVWGKDDKGFLRYFILPHLKVKAERESSFDASKLSNDPLPGPVLRERLFLGCQKQQNWERVQKTANPVEILPYIYSLGQWYSGKAQGGTAELVEKLMCADKVEWCEAFTTLFKGGFEGILSPRRNDTDHQGISFVEPFQGNASALIHLTQQAIRSLFIDENRLLPQVPPQFHCGKLMNLQYGPHRFDIEWTKKSLRRMIIQAGRTEELTLLFPKEMKRYRLRHACQGKQMSTRDVLSLEKGQVYYLDRFEA